MKRNVNKHLDSWRHHLKSPIHFVFSGFFNSMLCTTSIFFIIKN